MHNICTNLYRRFWKTSIYSSDLLLSIAMVLLGMIVYRFVPTSEAYLFPLANIIGTNQKYVSLFLICVGFLQLWHVNFGSERRKIPHIIHTLALFLSLGIWLTLSVFSIYNSSTIPVATATYISLTLTSVWVFIRYGCK